MNFYRFVFAGFFFLTTFQLYSQCSGFPATVADGNCASGTPLSSGANINPGNNLSFCGPNSTFQTFNNLNLNGGSIRICGNANLQGNWNSGTIVISCGSTVNFPSGLLLNNNLKVINYGTVTVTGNLEFQNTDNCFYNENVSSSLTVNGNLIYPQNTNQTAYLKNAGYIKVTGTFNAREGGFTCFTNTGRMECAHLNYIQNCGGPANRFTFGSATGTCILRYTGSAVINASFTTASNWNIYKAATSTQTFNCSASWGSATIVNNTSALTPPSTPQVCSTSNCFTVLPIELIAFTGKYQERLVHLNWTTASEQNNDFFTIEKSKDAIQWTLAATIGGAGTSNHSINYSWTDETPFEGINYYRLSQTDYDGTTVEKAIISVTVASSDAWDFKVYPNPSNGVVNLTLPGTSDEEYMLDITDLTGRKVLSRTIGASPSMYTLDISELKNGIYSLCLYDASHLLGTVKLLKN